MIEIFKSDLETGGLVEAQTLEVGCWINLVAPTREEISEVCEIAGISSEFIDYALDREERPRIDRDEGEGTCLILIDVPIEIPGSSKSGASFDTIPLGMIVVHKKMFITVSLQQTTVIERFRTGRDSVLSTLMKSRFALQIFYGSSADYLARLKRLDKERMHVESELAKSYKNKELIGLLDIQKSLVYFETSLKANEAVMEKLRRGKILHLYNDDEELLEDAIIENKQALEMTQIHAKVLDSTMEVYGSLISNNLSAIMRFLTSVTIFLAIPTMVAGFWGMNVEIPFQEEALSFWAVLVGSIVLAILVSFLVNHRKA